MDTKFLIENFHGIPRLMKNLFHKFDISDLNIPINKTQEKTLMFIMSHSNKPMSEIGKFVGLEKGSFTSATDHLKELGYIRRVRSEKDRRIIYLQLTDEGKKVTERIKEEFDKQLREKLEDFSEEELKEYCISLQNVEKYTKKLISAEIKSKGVI